MPEESSKFSGALAKLGKRQTAATAEEPPIVSDPVVEAGTERGRGRPHGKRSNPDYQPTTVLLRKQTKKAASRMLEDSGEAQDLSELIEQLLTEWLQQRL